MEDSMLMMSFLYENEKLVRTVEIEGVYWFVAKDLAEILEYSETEAMTRRLDYEDVGSYADKTSGQGRAMSIINEAGLYTAIFASKKPEAKKFKRWVTSEVLPSIRKTGKYEHKKAALFAEFDELEKEYIGESTIEITFILERLQEMADATVYSFDYFHNTFLHKMRMRIMGDIKTANHIECAEYVLDDLKEWSKARMKMIEEVIDYLENQLEEGGGYAYCEVTEICTAIGFTHERVRQIVKLLTYNTFLRERSVKIHRTKKQYGYSFCKKIRVVCPFEDG
jgi:prophage antirepressor-like protein